MNKYIKKVFLGILSFVIMFACFITDISNVNASSIVDNRGNEVTIESSYDDGDCYYGVKENVESKRLEFGLIYRYDKGYVNTMKEDYINADMNACGGYAYASSGKMLANTYYPTDVRLFEIPSELGLEIVPWVKFKNGNWSLNSVLAMASDYEASHPGYKVVGAINGDFFDINSNANYNYCSTGGTSAEGNNYKVVTDWNQIGFKDGTLVGNIRPTVSDKPVVEVFDKEGNVIYKTTVNKINSDPETNETSVFMAFWDSDHKAVSFDVSDCYVVDADILVPYSDTSIYGIGLVNSNNSVTLGKKNFAIKTNNSELKKLLEVGAKVRVQFEYTNDLEGYDNVVGYPHTVLVDGKCVYPGDYRHPRTCIGVKEDGTIIMAEIDGRQPNIDCYGCSLSEEAVLMKYYGCTQAYNLDGGGSSTICIIQDGELTIQNSPSDGHARSDGNCLLIVAKVPVLEISGENVSQNSFGFNVNVKEAMEKYNDLYVKFDCDNEFKKVENNKAIVYSNLTKNTKYNYQLYAKINDDYCMIPYSGSIYSAKDKYVFNDLKIELTTQQDNLYYDVSFSLVDTDETIVTSAIVIDGKRYNARKEHILIPVTSFSPLSSASIFNVTYNLNDLNGRVSEESAVSVMVKDASILFDACMDEVGVLMGNFIN